MLGIMGLKNKTLRFVRGGNKMKDFEIVIKPKRGGSFTFLTRANNGKLALKNLISRSNDFKKILGIEDCNNMIIEIMVC